MDSIRQISVRPRERRPVSGVSDLFATNRHAPAGAPSRHGKSGAAAMTTPTPLPSGHKACVAQECDGKMIAVSE